MGTFEVSGGKINAWRDYFDMNQFTSRMDKDARAPGCGSRSPLSAPSQE